MKDDPLEKREEFGMRAFLSAVAVAIVLAVGAAFVLDGSFQRPASEANTSEGVRVGDPGDNLVDY